MYRESTISSDVPARKLTKAFKNGKLSLTANELKGGSVIHLHPASYEKKNYQSSFAKTSGLLSKAADALGAPQAAIPARAAIRSMTEVGVYDSDSDVEMDGGRLTVADMKRGAKRALSYAKRRGVLTDAVDAGEKFLLSNAMKQEHEDLIRSIRGEVKRRCGVSVAKGNRPVKGSRESKDRMAAVRAKRRGGSFRL
ncbi:unnamed protein product [Phytophthora lilii]|uniref:Unnamed protein product n=1 Tax=Phytophthora lilii TaxID=2077276 RepID=A0A9W6UEL1_9STRA|nr:unnamed protein product [Phytophthora lilii]